MAESETAVEEKKPNGLGGWLILPAIGVILGPFMLLVSIPSIFPEHAVWKLATTPGTELYHPLLGPLIIFEAVASIGFLIAYLLLAFWFFNKSRHFPKGFIIILCASALFHFVDITIAGFIPAVAKSPNIIDFKPLIKSIIACAIWIPYFLVSVRVKNTFVN